MSSGPVAVSPCEHLEPLRRSPPAGGRRRSRWPRAAAHPPVGPAGRRPRGRAARGIPSGGWSRSAPARRRSAPASGRGGDRARRRPSGPPATAPARSRAARRCTPSRSRPTGSTPSTRWRRPARRRSRRRTAPTGPGRCRRSQRSATRNQNAAATALVTAANRLIRTAYESRQREQAEHVGQDHEQRIARRMRDAEHLAPPRCTPTCPRTPSSAPASRT